MGLTEGDMDAIPALQAAVYGTQGFTLVEVLVALGILSLAIALAGSGLFQVFSFQTSYQDKVVATKDLRHAGSWFSGDALNAQAAVDGNGEPLDCLSASDSVTLSWTGNDGAYHSSTYQVSGDSFERAYDGRVNTLADHVVSNSVGFLHCGNLLTLELEVEADPGQAKNTVLWTYLRRQE